MPRQPSIWRTAPSQSASLRMWSVEGPQPRRSRSGARKSSMHSMISWFWAPARVRGSLTVAALPHTFAHDSPSLLRCQHSLSKRTPPRHMLSSTWHMSGCAVDGASSATLRSATALKDGRMLVYRRSVPPPLELSFSPNDRRALCQRFRGIATRRLPINGLCTASCRPRVLPYMYIEMRPNGPRKEYVWRLVRSEVCGGRGGDEYMYVKRQLKQTNGWFARRRLTVFTVCSRLSRPPQADPR
jgi:hypothetical protein